MNQENEIDYADVVKYGFNEEEINDNVFFNKHGYKCRIISKKLYKKIIMYWHIDTRTAELMKLDKENNVLSKMDIKNLNHFHEIMEFFTESET